MAEHTVGTLRLHDETDFEKHCRYGLRTRSVLPVQALARTLELVGSGGHGPVAGTLIMEDDPHNRHSVGPGNAFTLGSEGSDLASGQEHHV